MVPKPLHPDQIKALPTSVGIEEGHGSSRDARKTIDLTDVSISRTTSALDRYYIEWAGDQFSEARCTRRTTLWGARRKARRMQRRINAAHAFNSKDMR